MPETKAIPFEAFVASLPSCSAHTRFPLSGARDDVLYRTDSLPEFVGPSLSTRTDIANAADPSVIIISAAGAVGKSTLAGQLARQKAAPLWDLSRSKSVGQGSVDGMITQVFGRGPKSSEVYSALREATLFMIVDALDEARVKVTESAFEDFLRDLGQLASEGSGVKAVLFGRTQVAETAWLLLDDQGVRTAFYTIDPFNEEQAVQYIERRIQRLDQRAATSMEQNPKPFAEARDLLFSRLRDAVRGNRSQEEAAAETKAFLGYAPVLDAMAIRLVREPNWSKQKQEIAESMEAARADSKHRPAAILRQVIEAVLSREHEQKLVSNLRPVLEPLAKATGWSDWPLLYSIDEQCARVLARHLGFPTKIGQTLNLPPDLGAPYEEHLSSWLPEHPFLRDGKTIVNVVFEAYLFARALSEDLGGARAAVEARLRQPSYLPTRLLSEFYLLSKSDQDTPEVMPEHVGWLYDSMLSDETPNVRVEFSMDGPDPFDSETHEGPHEVEGEFVFVRNGGLDESSRRVEFKTRVWGRSTITFGRYIKHSLVTLPCEVVVGAGVDEFEIGPRVQIACRKLRLSTQALVIGGKTRSEDPETNAVVLEAQECQTDVAFKPTVRTIPLRVSWPGSNVFPWTDYSQEQKDPYQPNSEMATAYRRFRRIVMTLRSHSRGGLARYKDKVDHQRVLKGPLGKELLARLLRDGIMRLSEEFYYWVPEMADRLVGISWHQLRRGETSPTLTGYLQSFLRSRS